MRKLFLSLIFLTLVVFSVSAQTDNWQTFAPADEQFSVEVPVELVREKSSSDSSNIRYDGQSDSVRFYIFSDDAKKSDYYQVVVKFISAYMQQTPTTLKIEDIEIEKYESAVNKVYFIKTKNRIYTFQTMGSSADETTAKRFFASIKVNKIVLFDNKKDADKKTKTVVNNPQKEKESNKTVIVPNTEINGLGKGSGSGTGIGEGSGNGIGRGQGSGVGNGIGTGNSKTEEKTKPVGETKGLTITSKPRANYTDFARFYRIQGTVTLRVTFNANGTIGSVTPVNSLPLGLTEQAISAAKRLTFQPALRNGQPISVIKMVQYSFTIY